MTPTRTTCDSNYTVEIWQGITYSREFKYTDVNGDAIDLTGKVISIKFKDVFPTQLELFSNTAPSVLGSTFLVTDAVNGKFRLQLTDEETATTDTGQGKWWIELYTGSDVDLLWIDSVLVKEL